MKRFTAIALMLAVMGSAVIASAATEVKMTGDARIWGNFFQNQNYTGWNATGTKTADDFVIWERFRLRSDFIANEGLKFRLGIRVNNKAWGNNTMTVDNPAVSIDVYECYLQFKWPGTNVEFTAGLAPINLPLSSPIFNANPVLGGGAPTAQFTINAPVNDNFSVVAGFARLLDGDAANGALFQSTTTSKVDTFDAFFLTLPITVDGFKAVPWAALGLAGRDANYAGTQTGSSPKPDNRNLGNNLLSAAGYSNMARSTNSMNTYWWVGSSFAVTALDPFKFYADVIYGEGNSGDRSRNKRSGWFFDVAAEYTGLDMVTPQIAFWYGSGEDNATNNGSERMPTVTAYWGAAHSFAFDSGQAYGNGYLATNPLGSYGIVVALDKISFVQDLTHRITFTWAHGNNSARAMRNANLLNGVGNYVQMGRDLTEDESVIAIGFDNQYNIYENLAAIVETGWAHGCNFQKSVWGTRMVHQANNGDVWKVAFGLQYKF